MTEATDQPAALTAMPDADEPVLSAGAMIRRAREASGLHIAALAVSLKVPVKGWKLWRPTGSSFCLIRSSPGRWLAAFAAP